MCKRNNDFGNVKFGSRFSQWSLFAAGTVHVVVQITTTQELHAHEKLQHKRCKIQRKENGSSLYLSRALESEF
jgi:hypothetical protein